MRSRSFVGSAVLVTALALGCSTQPPPPEAAASSSTPSAASTITEPIASATGSATSAAYQTYSPEGEGFSALMPTPVRVTPKEDGTKVFTGQLADGSGFTVICPLRQPTASPGMELLGFKEGVLKGAQIAEDRTVAVDGVEGYEVTATKERNAVSYSMHVRVLGKTRRMCVFVAAIPDGIEHKAETRAFLDSARVVE